MEEPRYRKFNVIISAAAATAAVTATLMGVLSYFHPSSFGIERDSASSNITTHGTVGSITQNVHNEFGPREPDPKSREGAIKQLRDRNLVFSAGGFEDAARSGDPDTVELYLRAGMSPNALIPQASFFIVWAVIQDNPDARAVLELFSKYNLSPGMSSRSTLIYSPPLLNMADQMYAAAGWNVEKIRMLHELGFKPDGLVPGYRKLCRSYLAHEGDFPGDPDHSAERVASLNVRLSALREGGVNAFVCR